MGNQWLLSSGKALTHVDNGNILEAWLALPRRRMSSTQLPRRNRREVLDVLITGEKAVGAILNDISMSQPQVSKHLRVLSEVGLVRCRAEGRRRLYRLEPARLRPMHDWLANYEQAWNERLDRMDDYLHELQQQGEQK